VVLENRARYPTQFNWLGGEAVKHRNWRETAELVGIFAILASLTFVALQLRQEQILTHTELRMSNVANKFAINSAIIENADIWVKGNEGQELSPVEMAIYRRLVNNINDYLFEYHLTLPLIDPGTEEQVLAMLAGFLHDNPGAYAVWLDRERRINFYRTAIDPSETITTEWVDAIESRMAILKQNRQP
jgi:hypothetical protein